MIEGILSGLTEVNVLVNIDIQACTIPTEF